MLNSGIRYTINIHDSSKTCFSFISVFFFPAADAPAFTLLMITCGVTRLRVAVAQSENLLFIRVAFHLLAELMEDNVKEAGKQISVYLHMSRWISLSLSQLRDADLIDRPAA